MPVVWVEEVQNNIRLYKGKLALALFKFRAFQFIYHNLNQETYRTVVLLPTKHLIRWALLSNTSEYNHFINFCFVYRAVAYRRTTGNALVWNAYSGQNCAQ